MSRRYMLAGLGVLALAAALAIPSLAQPRLGALTVDSAADRVRQVLQARGETDLTVGEVMEFSNHFYVLVKEESTGVGAFELIVERNGFIHPEPPSMMWNTKYGHMAGHGGMGMMGGGMMGYGYAPGPHGWSGQPGAPAQAMVIKRAKQVAAQYLSTAFPEVTPDEGTAFYGYFTFDAERDGTAVGMLSVNAFTGQVWYHHWHGGFVREKEF